MNNKSPCISVVCPLLNEQDMLGFLLEHLVDALRKVGRSYELVMVDDGSIDGTAERLLKLKEQYPQIRLITLSRNFGKEAALTAGIDCAKGDVVIPFDADMQDPADLIGQFIEKWEEGFDVVLAKRVDRTNDNYLKRMSALAFYKFSNLISDIEIPENVGDCRLMSRRVVDAVKLLPERQRFMKGIFSWVGFKTTTITYTRDSRVAGESKFNSWRLWNFALDGITSFSTAPIRVWFYIGLFISMVSFLYGGVIIIKTLFYGVDVPGYASLFTAVLFFGGVQLLSVGILGEYIGRIYIEVKARPLYVIESEK